MTALESTIIYISLVLSHELGYRDFLFVYDSVAVNYMDAYNTKKVYHNQCDWEWCVLANEFAAISWLLLLWWRWMGKRRRRPTNTVKLTIFPVTLIQNFKNSCRCKCLYFWSCHQWWLILQSIAIIITVVTTMNWGGRRRRSPTIWGSPSKCLFF